MCCNFLGPFWGLVRWLELTSFQEAAFWQKDEKNIPSHQFQGTSGPFLGAWNFFEGFVGSLKKTQGLFFPRIHVFFLGGGAWLKNDQLINVMCWNFGKSMNITYIHPGSAWPPYLIGCFMNYHFSIKDFLSSKRNCQLPRYSKPCWSEANVWICTGIWPLCCLEMWFLWGRIWEKSVTAWQEDIHSPKFT